MFVATKSSVLKGLNGNSCETVTFHNKSKKTSKLIFNEKDCVSDKKKKLNFNDVGDMKKLRYEIIKFGMSGFSGREKEDANVALMVSLGAEPPKKEKRNYKEILSEKKKESDKVEVGKYKSISLKKKKVNAASKKHRKRDLKGLLDVYGEVNKNQKIFKRKEKG